MTEPFPLLELPNDCIEYILSKLSLRDLKRLGKVPLGDARSVYKYIVDNHEDKVFMDLKNLSWRVKDRNVWQPNVSMEIKCNVAMSRHRQNFEIKDIVLRINRCHPQNTGLVHYDVCEVNPYRHIVSLVHRPGEISSIRRCHAEMSVPAFLPLLIEEMFPRLRGHGYQRCKERRDNMIATLGTILRYIDSQ